MKPFLSQILYENAHEQGGVLPMRGLPQVVEGLCTFAIYNTPFRFRHPRHPDWQEPSRGFSWKDMREPGWVADWVANNGVCEWFSQTRVPDGAGHVMLHSDLEALPVLAKWTTADESAWPTDDDYEAVVAKGLPMLYSAVQAIAAKAWPEVSVSIGHTNHVRAAPYAGSGPYAFSRDAMLVRDLSQRLLPVGCFLPVKAFWKHESEHAEWSVEECSAHVMRSLSLALAVSGNMPIALNIGIHNHKNQGLIRPEELAGSLLAAEAVGGVAASWLWGTVGTLEASLGNHWRSRVETLIGRALEMLEERGVS